MKKILLILSVFVSFVLISCSTPSGGDTPSSNTPVATTPAPGTPTNTQPETPAEPEPTNQPQNPETPTTSQPETPTEVSPWILVVKDSSAGTRGNAGTDFVYIDETVANPFAALVNAGTVQLELVGKRELKTSSNKWYGTSATDKISVVNQYKVYVHKDAVNSEYFLEDTSLKYYLTTANSNYAFRYRIVKENDVWKMSVVHHNSLGANYKPLDIVKNSYSVKNN